MVVVPLEVKQAGRDPSGFICVMSSLTTLLGPYLANHVPTTAGGANLRGNQYAAQLDDAQAVLPRSSETEDGTRKAFLAARAELRVRDVKNRGERQQDHKTRSG